MPFDPRVKVKPLNQQVKKIFSAASSWEAGILLFGRRWGDVKGG